MVLAAQRLAPNIVPVIALPEQRQALTAHQSGCKQSWLDTQRLACVSSSQPQLCLWRSGRPTVTIPNEKRVSSQRLACDAGKTTLLRLIAGLEEPTEGKVFFGGELNFTGKHLQSVTVLHPRMHTQSLCHLSVPNHATCVGMTCMAFLRCSSPRTLACEMLVPVNGRNATLARVCKHCYLH